jgi:hypothetical protein
MVLHGTTFFADEGMFPLFTQLSADCLLRTLVNNVAIHFDLMVANVCLLVLLTRRQ